MIKNIIIICESICLFIICIMIFIQKGILTSSELASWVQAIGSIGAVIGLIYTFHKQNKLRQNEIDYERNLRREEQVRNENEEKYRRFTTDIFLYRHIKILLSETIEFMRIQKNSLNPRSYTRNDLFVSHLLERLWKTEEHILHLTTLTSDHNEMTYCIQLARNSLQYLQQILSLNFAQGDTFYPIERATLDKNIQNLEYRRDLIQKAFEKRNSA